MKDLAQDMESITRQQLALIKQASTSRALTLEEWNALESCSRVVRTLALNNVSKEKDATQLPDGMTRDELAAALDALRRGAL